MPLSLGFAVRTGNRHAPTNYHFSHALWARSSCRMRTPLQGAAQKRQALDPGKKTLSSEILHPKSLQGAAQKRQALDPGKRDCTGTKALPTGLI